MNKIESPAESTIRIICETGVIAIMRAQSS